MSNEFFWNFTNDDIINGLAMVHDWAAQNTDDPLYVFVMNTYLYKLATLLIECEFDRTLMKLKYSNEIERLLK